MSGFPRLRESHRPEHEDEQRHEHVDGAQRALHHLREKKLREKRRGQWNLIVATRVLRGVPHDRVDEQGVEEKRENQADETVPERDLHLLRGETLLEPDRTTLKL